MLPNLARRTQSGTGAFLIALADICRILALNSRTGVDALDASFRYVVRITTGTRSESVEVNKDVNFMQRLRTSASQRLRSMWRTRGVDARFSVVLQPRMTEKSGRGDMRGRDVRREHTRLRIIRAAANLFHKQGIHVTSPDDIIEASGTGKGQLYHYFRNKEALVHEVMQFHLNAIENDTFPVNCNVDSWESLESWFNRHIELLKMFEMTRSCPIGTIGNDVTEKDELIRQDVCLIFEAMKRKLLMFFLREKAAGRLSSDASEEALATFCISTMQGATLLGKIARSSRPAELAVKEAMAHLRRYIV